MSFFRSFVQGMWLDKDVVLKKPQSGVSTRVKKISLLLYRVELHRDPVYSHWSTGYVYVLAYKAEGARAMVKRFARNKGFERTLKSVSVCGRKSQEKINVITKDNEITTLRERALLPHTFGIIAFSSCREGINKNIAYVVDSKYNSITCGQEEQDEINS